MINSIKIGRCLLTNQDNHNPSVKDELDVLECTHVLSPPDNYRGISYGELIVRWTRWLMSASPDNYKVEDFLFLRGNIGHHSKPDSFYEAPKIAVEQGTAILIPIITTFYMIGDPYEGVVIEDEELLRHALYEHVNAAGPFWATIKIIDIPGQQIKRIVKNLEDFRFESPLFCLTVSEKNPFLNKMDVPVIPGTHAALAGGYFVLLKDLPPSQFRIRFGGKGLSIFFTDSLYEITVNARLSTTSKDISGYNTSPDMLIQKNEDRRDSSIGR
jgi:hypothetical protein